MTLDQKIDMKIFLEFLLSKKRTKNYAYSIILKLMGHSNEEIGEMVGIEEQSVRRAFMKSKRVFEKFSSRINTREPA